MTIKRIIIFCLFVLSLLPLSCSIPVKELILNHENVTIEIDMSEQLELTFEPVEAAIPEIEWLSNNPNIAQVDSTGLITAISPGIAIITVRTVDGKLFDECVVTVTPRSVQGVSLDRDSLELEIGNTVHLQASIIPEDAGNQNVIWDTSDDLVASVNENGMVLAKSPGTTMITAVTEDGGFRASCSVAVKAPPPPPPSTPPATDKESSSESSKTKKPPADPKIIQFTGFENYIILFFNEAFSNEYVRFDATAGTKSVFSESHGYSIAKFYIKIEAKHILNNKVIGHPVCNYRAEFNLKNNNYTIQGKTDNNAYFSEGIDTRGEYPGVINIYIKYEGTDYLLAYKKLFGW